MFFKYLVSLYFICMSLGLFKILDKLTTKRIFGILLILIKTLKQRHVVAIQSFNKAEWNMSLIQSDLMFSPLLSFWSCPCYILFKRFSETKAEMMVKPQDPLLLSRTPSQEKPQFRSLLTFSDRLLSFLQSFNNTQTHTHTPNSN